jgi:hypothetical protein
VDGLIESRPDVGEGSMKVNAGLTAMEKDE